ncbi:unnamed protein product, partial [Iphiclides podalirius]
MLVRDVFVELRSRLRSCNVFITTGAKLNDNCNLKINIQPGCITLNYYEGLGQRRGSLSSIESLSDCCSEEEECSDSASIAFDGHCQLIPNSMSCLKIGGGTISFRILTRPKGGDFFTELVPAGGPSETLESKEPKVCVEPGRDTAFSCANCSNKVTEGRVKFDRVLELPTTSLDASEWFCHGHDAVGTCDLAPKPKSADFLYRLTHFVVNATALSPKTNRFNAKREVYHCERCLAWLGVKERDGVKLFNCELMLHQDDWCGRVFLHGFQTADCVVDDFVYTIERLTREANLGLQYSVMCRIVLECAFASASKRYLLVWVMDRRLEVLRRKDSVDGRVSLQSSFLTKILYRVEGSLNEEVESWLADPAVVSADISKAMFCRGVEHLRSTSQKVPESFRSANGFSVSYLKV